MRDAFICDAVRTPVGRYGGSLAGVRADDLGAMPLRALLRRYGDVDWAAVDDVVLGCANQAGEDNRNVARMSASMAGLPVEVPGTTVNRLCGSGMDAIGIAARAIKAGDAELLLAGGGLSEVMGPGVASECIETKDGPTIWEDHFYPEVIDPLTGRVLPDGEEGELVFTTLTKEALPMIRYRTRDLSRLLPPSARSMRRMDKITSRSDDMIIIRGVNVFPTQIEEIVLKMPTLAPCYQLVVSREGHRDQLEIHVEERALPAGTQPCDRDAVARELQHHIRTHVGVSTRVLVVDPRGIARSEGKARRVVDNRPKA